jgi:uncharacterized membrane protein
MMVIAPAVALAMVWALASSADVAVWRLVEIYAIDPHQFDPKHKLVLLLADPLAFPRDVIATLRGIDPGEFLGQVVGVLGLFDTVLQGWTYPTLAALTLACFATSSDLDVPGRGRAAFAAAFTTLAYVTTVFLIFWLVWTPLDSATIWGVQGRYFLPVLPLLAIVPAATRRGLPAGPGAAFASAGAVLSGWACIDAILRADWRF